MVNYSKTAWHSYKTGKICKGCKQCVKGQKLVLFITGLCPRKCVYCPISSKKYGKDVVFANEWEIKDVNNPVELFEEVRMTAAKGAGITGGDPLARIERTCKYIKDLKKEFGESFHIHLYTSLNLVSEKNLKLLFDAGLDEIRFHPDLKNTSLWDRLSLAKKFEWDVGVEVPILPDAEKELIELIDFIKDKIDFLNLNELEFSDTDTPHYFLSNYKKKNNSSYGVLASEELALKLLDICAAKNIDAHYCTAKLKNMVQVGERLKRRALNVALDTDELTEEYLLYRGAIYLKGFEPGFDYGQGLNQKSNVDDLKKAFTNLVDSGFSEDSLTFDYQRNRLLTHFSLVSDNSDLIKSLNLIPAIVEEYPSSDYFCTELEFL